MTFGRPSARQANAPDKMTRAHNRTAAFSAVTLCFDLDRLDTAFVARCHGMTQEQVQELVANERARRAVNRAG